MPTALKGWHRGELAIQSKLGYNEVMADAYTWVESRLPQQHRNFHHTRLPFVPLTTLDGDGRPWSSPVAGASGRPGFIDSPSDKELDINLTVWKGDPLLENLKLFDQGERILVAGLGIEFSTRRRNKFAGWATQINRKDNNVVQMRLNVNETIGNCPKYINVRDLIPYPQTAPKIVHRKLELKEDHRLPEELIAFIHTCDTAFLGTTFQAQRNEESKFPSHVGMNHRGGRAGFVRVKPSDGRTVVLPDYSGNRLMTSLGNIEATPAASLSFLCFTTGDILYLTGDAQTLIGEAAQRVMPRQNVLTTLFVTGYVFVRDAMPSRQRPGSGIERSPYSPPIRYLAEEKSDSTSLDDVSATLKSIEVLSPSLVAFMFETSQPVKIYAGQAAILDFTEVLGAQEYAHMADGNEASLNDDRIRTWTVSDAHSAEGTRNFTLTMREKPGGMVTGALFRLVRRIAQKRPELLLDASPLNLKTRLIGIGGEFVLPAGERALLWIAGGIGVTPFLSMLSAIVGSPEAGEYDIAMILSTREPELLLSLIDRVLCTRSPPNGSNTGVKYTVDVYTQAKVTSSLSSQGAVRVHNVRFSRASFALNKMQIEARVAFICGPLSFEEVAVGALTDLGMDLGPIIRENFAY